MSVNSTYFIIENVDTQERTYILIKNLMRFRRATAMSSQYNEEWSKDKIYLQFIHKDDYRVGYFLTKEQWGKFQESLPFPPKVYCVNPPPSNRFLPDNESARLVVVNKEEL